MEDWLGAKRLWVLTRCVSESKYCVGFSGSSWRMLWMRASRRLGGELSHAANELVAGLATISAHALPVKTTRAESSAAAARQNGIAVGGAEELRSRVKG